MSRPGTVLLLAGLVAALGIATAIDWLRESHRREHIFDHGTEVEAVIWGRRDNSRTNELNYTLDVRFRADERTQIVLVQVSRDFYERASKWNHIRVKYLPTDPEQVVVLDDDDPMRTQFWLAGLLLLVSAIVGFIGLRWKATVT